MQVITTTQLRTKSKDLVKALLGGQSVNLIHRSRVVGQIKPIYEAKPLTQESIRKIRAAAKSLNLPHITYKERSRTYRKHLMEKYGKGLS